MEYLFSLLQILYRIIADFGKAKYVSIFIQIVKKNQMNVTAIKEKLIQLLAQDPGIVLKELSAMVDLSLDVRVRELVILKEAEHEILMKDIKAGIKSASSLDRREKHLRNNIFQIIKELKESDLVMAAANSFLQKNVESENQGGSGSSSGVYISYAWGGESEKIVDLIDTELKNRGLTLIRDKRDLGYKGSIVGFMEDIGKGNKIVVVISKKYLESENCMFELTQIYENKDFAKRIFPIVLEDANIYSPISRIQYIKYWNDKITELDTAIKSVGTGLNITQLQQELNNYGDIRASFDKMAFILKDMNALTPEMHRNKNFEDLYQQLMEE